MTEVIELDDSMDEDTTEKLINSFLSREKIRVRVFYMNENSDCADIVNILSIKRLDDPKELRQEFIEKIEGVDNVLIFNISRMEWTDYFTRFETIWIRSEPLQVIFVEENLETIECAVRFETLSGEEGLFEEIGIYSDEKNINWRPVDHTRIGQLTKGVR